TTGTTGTTEGTTGTTGTTEGTTGTTGTTEGTTGTTGTTEGTTGTTEGTDDSQPDDLESLLALNKEGTTGTTGTTEGTAGTTGTTEGTAGTQLPTLATLRPTTTGGGTEDKVKAAEDAKAVVTNLENQLNNLKAQQAGAAPQDKVAFEGPIAALQSALIAVKKDAADKEAAAKTTTTPGTTTPGTTTPGTTTGGDTTKTSTTSSGEKLEFPNAEEKGKFDTAQKEAADLKTQLDKKKEAIAKFEAAKNTNNPFPPIIGETLKKQAADLEIQLTAAQKKVSDLAKGAKIIPATIPGKKIEPNGGDGTTGNNNLPGQKPPTKNVFNDNDRKVKFVDRTKVIYRDNDDDDTDKEYIISSNKNTCPTQSETVALNGKINPKGIRILADFDPCRISDGSVTLNMPNTGSIKLALLFIDNVGNNDAGVLVKPLKIQDLSTNQALYSVELDGNMNGINPLSGQSTSISRINGLALYNDGNEPIQFNSGNIAALTATFTK
ncbi:MAG TPA: hypothetical protein VJ697_00175, partial [Nitrososphaeraceae archaeon]|nr:hypothetical protein [Nitrososphaeraceae archaeon]